MSNRQGVTIVQAGGWIGGVSKWGEKKKGKVSVRILVTVIIMTRVRVRVRV
jgi:hypothetical protein